MRLLLIALFLALTLQAESFSSRTILGVWQISSLSPNGFIYFGKDIGTERRESWTLMFNRE